MKIKNNIHLPLFHRKYLKHWRNFLIPLWIMRILEVAWETMNGARNGTRTRDPELGKYAYLI